MSRDRPGAALITGAAKRIGKSISLALADDGYDIALHCNRSAEAAAHLQETIRGMGRRCEVFSADLGREREVTELTARVIRRFPDLRLLVNNASIFEPGRLVETEVEHLDTHLNVNLKAPFLLTRDFARAAKQGQVINILDTRIFGTTPGYVAYSVSKSALWALSRMAAQELGPEIRVNAIAPGLILPPPGQGESYLEKMAGRVPLKKSGGPADVVRAVRYLLASEFVTGECLMLDGGEWLR